MNKHALEWILSGEGGESSNFLVLYLEYAMTNEVASLHPRHPLPFPHDPADFGRCMQALALDPNYRSRMAGMSTMSPEWAALVSHWDELEALYYAEAPSGVAPQLYARMQELINEARHER